MAAFSPKSTPPYNVRSVSFPARSHHPSLAKLEQKLNKISSWQVPTPLKAGTVLGRLSSLGEIYKSIEDLLNLPMTQQALLQHQNEKLVDDMLDGLMRYLDICGKARDAALLMNESIRELQSALRRSKAGGELSIQSNVNAYFCARKKMKKEVAKSLASLKKADNIFEGSLLLKSKVLSEASLITVSIFTSLLLFLSVPMMKPRPSKWYLVSKLVHKGVLPCEGQQENLNELESVDAALANLVVPSSGKDFEAREIHSAQQRLEILHASIEEVENELDSLFRHFIHARVSLLNILSQ
ncbi:BPS1-LIKE PROTEIN [Salix viminalis]|uniref:BPS1-LIKE PROTEIN n=1 Tax=Salix viminalis TaxID=40686 RepID=A0A9Q0UVI2_SALVM|nr:BPS1-LIKE PROTEIN [Salix viminalis]